MNKDIIKCTRCGTKNTGDWLYCASCGEALEAPKASVKKCPQCDSVFESKITFCGKCGTKLIVEDEAKEEESNSCVCASCGTKNDPLFEFCTVCGTKLGKPLKEKECAICKTKCAPETLFCSSCGASLNSCSAVTQPVKVKKARQPKYDFKKIISASVLLALSLLLFICTFLPISKQNNAYFGNEQVSITFNSYESIGLMFDLFKHQSYEEISDSKLGLKLDELSMKGELINEKYDDDYPILKSDKKILSQYIKCLYKSSLRNKDNPFSYSILITGLASTAYVAFSVLALIFAILTFISVFTGKKTSRSKCIKCIIFAPFMLLVSAISFKFAFRALIRILDSWWIQLTLGVYIDENQKLSHPILVVGMIIMSAIIISGVIERKIRKKENFSIKKSIFNLIIASVAITTAFLCTANVMRVSVNAKFQDRASYITVTQGVPASFYEDLQDEWDFESKEVEALIIETFNQSKNPEEEKRTHLLTIIDRLKYRGDLEYYIYAAIARPLTLLNANNNYATSFSTTLLFSFIALIFSLLIAAFALTRLTLGCENTKSPLSLTIPCAISAITAFIINLVFIITINKAYAHYRLSSHIKFKIGFGIICLVVFSILLLVSSFINAKDKNKIKKTIKS